MITDKFPNVIVIIMSVQSENEYLKKAMFHGAKEYVIKPFNYETLVGTIKTTYDKYKDRQLIATVVNPAANKNAKKIAFFSSKGGTGKSVLALNTSILLGRDPLKKVLLFDLDLLFGDISMLVNQYKQKTIMDLIDDGQLDMYESMKQYFFSYNKTVDILFAPDKPESAEYIGKDMIEKIIKSVEHYYDYIIIDTGTNFNDTTLYALDCADKIIVVTTNEIVSLKNTKVGLSVMQSLGYENNKVKLVINRFTTDYGISKNEVEDAFQDIIGMIPEDLQTVSLSVNKGIPFCEDTKYSKSKIGKAMDSLCKEIIS
jgi:pilus assembly protein CpaE